MTMFEIALPRVIKFRYSYVTGKNEPYIEFVDWKLANIYKKWCKETLMQDTWNYYGAEKKTPCVLRFKHEEDLLAFRLTFGL